VSKRRARRSRIILIICLCIFAPLSLLWCFLGMEERRWYFCGLLLILWTMIPFFASFERKHLQARDIVLIVVMTALIVAGRALFFALPNFKPMLAMVIIFGAYFGAETGAFVGSFSAFVSNFFFGQGPWTPWQMFCFGLVGFLAGLIFYGGNFYPNKWKLSLLGIVSAVIYGAIMNPVSVLLAQALPTKEVFIAAYITALPFDISHMAATVFFLFLFSEPVGKKLERVKNKYGLIKQEKPA